METKKTKLTYNLPQITKILLDNEISLALDSAPPDGPNEVDVLKPEYFNNNPFKSNIC